MLRSLIRPAFLGAAVIFYASWAPANGPKASPSRTVIVGAFDSPDGATFYLAPFLSYTRGQYQSLMEEDPKQSILNTFKNFDVYQNERRVGTFAVRRITGPTSFAALVKVVADGAASGFKPGYDQIAIANGPRQRKWRGGELNADQTARLKKKALALLPTNMPANDFFPGLVGKPVLVKEIHEHTDVLDLNGNGMFAVAYRLDATVECGGRGFDAAVFLFEEGSPRQRQNRTLLSSAVITDSGQSISGGESYSFFAATDIDGDGTAEVLLYASEGEGSQIKIFTFRDHTLHLVCTVGWSGS